MKLNLLPISYLYSALQEPIGVLPDYKTAKPVSVLLFVCDFDSVWL